jgi:threonine aldolase
MPKKKPSKKPAAPQYIDLRSDTVTLPTPEMRRAMAEAEVGDDVYAEDPTINKLEARAAELFGREAAIFVPSGTMGNQIAIKLHTRPGQEIICDSRAHILDWEMAMIGAFSGCITRTIATADGILTWDEIRQRIRPKGYAFAQTGLVALENTHNMAGGTVYPTKVVNDICDHAHAAGIPVHMDGARIFNAAVALGRPVRELAAKPDSIMFCLSKGLGAPVGSMLVGNGDFIARARSVRKALGGGMRQAGILAAAGLISLNQMVNRLKDDHANARFLAEGLAKMKGVRVEPKKVQTNIVVFELERGTAAVLSRRLRERGVLANPATSATNMRFVTHMNVDRDACRRALIVLAEALRA